jgi:chromatin assembly factor 1 subunit B
VENHGEERKITYLSTLVKHTQAVNVVRWCPRGAFNHQGCQRTTANKFQARCWPRRVTTATCCFGFQLTATPHTPTLKRASRTRRPGESRPCADRLALKSTILLGLRMASSSLRAAWIILLAYTTLRQVQLNFQHTMQFTQDHSGSIVRQIAEHNHYVQGVAWDPLNEYIATQSSDRSVHIYTLKNKDGQFSLAQHAKVTKMDLPARRVSSNSPAPPDFGGRASFVSDSNFAIGSPVPSMPGTPQSLALPQMHPPPTSHSRRSSFGSSPSMRRSASPAPSMPLPAVMPNSPSLNSITGLGVRNAPIYFNETLTSFFRRLTFAPDGSLLFTPAGQYKALHPAINEAKPAEDITNTVYIYTRAGLNKPPVAYLPGHKKPSVAVRCSPVYYTIRQSPLPTKQITIDTSHDDDIPSLPEPFMPSRPPTSHSSMDPPPVTSAPSPSPSISAPSPKPADGENGTPAPPPAGPAPAFSLPYRMIYAVATQDAIHVYDTQQQKPLCIVSNLHFATFTDITWYVQ